ncbi:MAG: hypothetical protein HUK02_01515 [Bacteroidaceae bacterium]|nr:hypothetical protein [Bacteroidaceae bacterium]
MGKHKRQSAPVRTAAPASANAPQKERKPFRIPVMGLLFVLVWAWGALWYGDVMRVAREWSFWAPDITLMQYESGRPWGALWHIGLALLQLWRWPVLGSAVLALLLTAATWLTAYCLRLRGWWQALAFVPVAVYLAVVAHQGVDIYFEAEPGRIMGIPFLYTLVVILLALIIFTFTRHHRLHPETLPQNRGIALVAVVTMAVSMAISQWLRPYVRVVTEMQCELMEQDWKAVQKTARAHPTLSYRMIAAYYAMATVQRGEQGSRLFDLLMDYDEPYIHGFDRDETTGQTYYLMECDYYAGLVQTAQHHAMENLTMCGPTLRSLKMLTKCALLRGEWTVAEKYLRILGKVPFEGAWVKRYTAMLRQPDAVNNDAEMKMVRMTEPVHDTFESQYIQPVFMGYNASLMEGRSVNALLNSLAVQLYTKTTQGFLARCEAYQGQMPPQTIAEALLMFSSKHPQLTEAFPGITMHQTRLGSYFQEVKPMMSDRQRYARELFPRYKGFYPYYYFFGNLKATKKQKDNGGTSNHGVN